MEFSMKDIYRASIEHASNGRNTVMYDKNGYPSIMVCIPRYDLHALGRTDLGTGIHPAFNVDGKIVNEIWIGKYQTSYLGNVPVSLQGKSIVYGKSHQVLQEDALNKGTGWHTITASEWAAIMLLCWINPVTKIHGNLGNINGLPRDPRFPNEIGGEYDADVGDYGMKFIKTGTGPASYSHDNTPFGVYDLIGNAWEYVSGVNIHNGGTVIWTGDEDGNYINRPFLKNVNMLDKKFDDGARKRICEDGWVYTHTWLGIDKFAGNFSLNSSNNMSTITGQNSVYGTLDGISNRCSGEAKQYLRTLKLIGVIPPDGARTGVRGQVEHSVAGYRSLVRGFRNGDNADYYSNAFGWGAPLTPGVCYTSRLAWVSPDKI